MAKNKHLTDLERLEIEHGVRHGLSLKKIAAKIGKHHSTVIHSIERVAEMSREDALFRGRVEKVRETVRHSQW